MRERVWEREREREREREYERERERDKCERIITISSCIARATLAARERERERGKERVSWQVREYIYTHIEK